MELEKQEISVFWFRRDLRFDDNTALYHALNNSQKVLPIFIFDDAIIEDLEKEDARINFIYDSLKKLNNTLVKINASIKILKGDVLDSWKQLLSEYTIKTVYFNHDYEPSAIKRDKSVSKLLADADVCVESYKDHVIFEKHDIVKKDNTPYLVYTPYKNKWLEKYNAQESSILQSEKLLDNCIKAKFDFPKLSDIGFERSAISVLDFDLSVVNDYNETRDVLNLSTSNLGPYLRFGMVSIRKLMQWAVNKNPVFCSELIWREFFMMILYHFPRVVKNNFKSKYDFIAWRNNEEEFYKWCMGETGYPVVDAGMRQLNTTGYMHNRVRMIVASFLCKHLLIDWRWGEAYFAQKLLDFELSSNNGNWQWVAGTGCDAAPYFRVFNPEAQQNKFDKNFEYVKKWIPEYSDSYLPEIVEHKFARERYLSVMKKSLQP